MKALRNYINDIKPNFINDGKYTKWFPLFDALENLFFSYSKKTKNPIHVRDAVDIQKVENISKEIELLLEKAKADDQIKLGVMSTLLDELKTKEELIKRKKKLN